MVDGAAGGILAGRLGLFRRPFGHPVRAGAFRVGHAGRSVVYRRAGQLRRAHVPRARPGAGRADRRQGIRAARSGTGQPPPDLGDAPRAGRRPGREAAGSGRGARKPGRGVRTERGRGGHRLLGHGEHGRHLVRLWPGLLPGGGGRAPGPAGPRGTDRGRRIPVRRPRIRQARGRRRAGRAAAWSARDARLSPAWATRGPGGEDIRLAHFGGVGRAGTGSRAVRCFFGGFGWAGTGSRAVRCFFGGVGWAGAAGRVVQSSDLDFVLFGDHRAAQGDRAQHGRGFA